MSTCGVCGDPLSKGSLKKCLVCTVSVHADCDEFVGKCIAYGCGASKSVRTSEPTDPVVHIDADGRMSVYNPLRRLRRAHRRIQQRNNYQRMFERPISTGIATAALIAMAAYALSMSPRESHYRDHTTYEYRVR